MKLTIFTDGASRSNPGPSASGFMILNDNASVLVQEEIFNGTRTNNFAEYNAIILALRKAASLYGYGNDIELYSDSELVVKQLNGQYKVKDAAIKDLHKDASALAGKFTSCMFYNVPRENANISAVDKALNNLLDNINKDGASDVSKHMGKQDLLR